MNDPLFALTRRHAIAVAAGGIISSQAIGKEGAAYPGLGLGRPHTDFINTQVAPARVLGEQNSEPGVEGTALSYNAKGDRAVTVMFRYTPGWTMDKLHYINSDQEFFVLDGSVEFDGMVYQQGDYAYLPAGYAHPLMKSANGAVLLNFYEGEHLPFYADAPPGMYKPEKLIKKTESHAMAWQSATDVASSSLGHTVKTKLLRTDAKTGERTWLVKVDADDGRGPVKRKIATHSAVEEMFIVEGQVATPHGRMGTGSYAWRAPGAPRGPFGTKTGYVALMRSKGGALQTTLSAQAYAVDWNASYDPSLPESARAFAFKDYDRQRKY